MTLREVGGGRGGYRGHHGSPLKGRGAIEGAMGVNLRGGGGYSWRHRSPFKGRGL